MSNHGIWIKLDLQNQTDPITPIITAQNDRLWILRMISLKLPNEIFATFESTPETFWASVKSLSPETRPSSSLIETLRISAPFWKCIGIKNNKYWNIFIRIYCKTTNQTPTQDLCSDTSQKKTFHYVMSNTKFCQGPASSIYPAKEKVSIDMKHFNLI